MKKLITILVLLMLLLVFFSCDFLPKNTYIVTASAGFGGRILPGGVNELLENSSQTFYIKANSQYTIEKVLVDEVDQGPISRYTFYDISSDHTISAHFSSSNSSSFTITASASTGGSITPSGTRTVSQGNSLTFSISPNQGYAISQVYVDGIGQGPLKSYTFSGISANHTILATFTSDIPSTYTIITAAGSGGSISPNGDITVNRGSDKLFTITPDSGYRVSNVTVDGIAKGAITSYTFYDVTLDHTIVATFASNSTSPTFYSITASADTGGSISPNGTSSVSEGDSLTYTIVPSHGYSIYQVYVDGVPQGPLSSYSFNNIVTDHTIFAIFRLFAESSG